MEKKKESIKTPSFQYSVVVLLLCCALLLVGTLIFKAPLQLMLLACWLIVIPAGMGLGYSYAETESAALDFVRRVMQPMMITLAVGTMIAAWIACGAVPTMVAFGIKLISPKFFLVTTLLLCSIVSLTTGTSTGTVGTVGIAIMGIGMALNIPSGMIVGAIISGAMFGDKMSPLSDTTVLCPAVAGCEVMTHVRHMFATTVPSYIISAVIFLVVGLQFGDMEMGSSVDEMLDVIHRSFNIHPINLIPVILVLGLLILRKPAFFSIMLGALAGFILAPITQNVAFNDLLTFMYKGYVLNSGNEMVDKLFSRGGTFSMAYVVLTMIFAFGFAGVMVKTKMMDALVAPVVKLCRSSGSLVLASGLLCWGVNLSGSLSLSQVMIGTLMAPVFKEKKLRPENLSRCLEDFGTFGTPLVPWSNFSMTTYGLLGVSTLAYAPWCFLLYITPIFDVIYAYTGKFVTRISDDEVLESV